MVRRAHSGLVHKVLTPSATMIRMDATWSLRFMAGTFCCLVYISGFPRLLESPGFSLLKIPGPEKSWKITLVLESPGN